MNFLLGETSSHFGVVPQQFAHADEATSCQRLLHPLHPHKAPLCSHVHLGEWTRWVDFGRVSFQTCLYGPRALNAWVTAKHVQNIPQGHRHQADVATTIGQLTGHANLVPH